MTTADGFAHTDPTDGPFFEQLTSRGLEQLAEAFLRRQLIDGQRTGQAGIDASIKLAGVLSRRAAAEVDGVRRRSGWAKADELLAPMLAAGREADFASFNLRRRAALLVMERAALTADLAKVLIDDADALNDARRSARRAAEQLAALAGEVRARLNQTVGTDREKWSKLAELDIRVHSEAGRAWLIVVLTEPDGEARDAAAAQSEKYLRADTKDFALSDTTLESFLALAELYRATKRGEEALQTLDPFDKHPETPRQYGLRAVLLSTRVLLDLGRTAAALNKLNVPDDKRLQPAGEWSLALFEAMLRTSGADLQATAKVQEDAITLLNGMEARYGRYWLLRGERVLAQYGDASLVGDNPALLLRVAALRRERKKWDEAIAVFDRAAEVAKTRNQEEIAVRSAVEAAGTTLEKGDAARAVERFLKVADEHPAHRLAADALLGAAGALYRQYKSAKDPQTLAKYQATLDRLLAMPNAEPALTAEAHWLRGGLAEQAKEFEEATRHYRLTPADHRRYAAAAGALAGLYYDELLATANPTPEALDRAIADLEARLPVLTAKLAKEPEITQTRCFVAWVLARLIALRRPERIEESLKLVTEVVVKNPALPANLQGTVWRTVLRWNLRLGRAEAAAAAVKEGFGNDAAGLVEILLQLSPSEEGLSAAERGARAATAEAAAEKWLDGSVEVPPRTRLNLRLLLGQAYIAKGAYSQASRLLRRLREEAPRDRRVAAALARCWYLAGDYDESLQEWTTLLNGLRRGEEDWLAAAVETCRCYIKLKTPEKAMRLLDFIAKNYADRGAPETKAKLSAVLKEIGK